MTVQLAECRDAALDERTRDVLAAGALTTTRNAWIDLFEAAEPAIRRRLGAEHRALGGATLFATPGVDHPMLNRVTSTSPQHVAEAVTTYRRLGVSRYLLSVDAADLSAALEAGEAFGLGRFRRAWATLARSGPGPAPEARARGGVSIRRAASSEAARIGDLMCDGFDLPTTAAPLFAAAVGRAKWEAVVADYDGTVVGAGLLYIEGDSACLFAGVTAPDYRRRGIQRALVTRRVRLAQARGATLICSETGVAVPGQPNPSWNNLVRAGLEPVHVTEHLCPAGMSWSSASS